MLDSLLDKAADISAILNGNRLKALLHYHEEDHNRKSAVSLGKSGSEKFAARRQVEKFT